ncbi:MAG: class I SAM-dependent methyltransferase [Legionellaceae bacterium]|nr:class I SAM-dependent methyltransferase [Legionellaceae bacterium]
MAYDQKFYRMYQRYLREEAVRANHDKIFEYFRRFTKPTQLRVVDLGCGLGEYSRYGSYAQYAGIDLNDTLHVKNFVQADYHDPHFVNRLPFIPTAFVSLFSIECCHSALDKYALYEKIFAYIPSIEYGMVGGFFYESRRDLETVGETGGIISYQTIEDSSRHISRIFSEFRIHMHTPSKMFGNDVIEIWKILSRW